MSSGAPDAAMSESGYVLVFDGGELALYGPDGAEVLTVAAVSGTPGSSPEDQTRSDYGPIPEGVYQVVPDEYRVGGPGGFFSRLGDWGDFAVDIHPIRETDTFGRDGFLLHGGSTRGSIGCIDVGPNDGAVYNALKDIEGSIRVEVKYDNPNAFKWTEGDYAGWDQPGGPPVDWSRPSAGFSMEADSAARSFNMEEYHKVEDTPGYTYDETWSSR